MSGMMFEELKCLSPRLYLCQRVWLKLSTKMHFHTFRQERMSQVLVKGTVGRINEVSRL